MQTSLAPAFQNRPDAQEAAALLRSCVHCGFCSATCPTYQILGDELDGPRGRLYLIKQVLEGDRPTARTRLHLDRCLTCRACETTCPSGVQYGRVLDTGRQLVNEQLPRSALARVTRRLLAAWLTGPLFAPAVALGRMLRVLPPAQAAGVVPDRLHARRMLLLAGCVQPSLSPNINAATLRVFDALGITLQVAPDAGCCGAIRHHLDDHDGALSKARRNIDAWWPAVEAGAEAIVLTASGCGTMLHEYGHLLRQDGAYAAKAARISALVRDVAEVLPALLAQLAPRLRERRAQRVVFHPPCSLQHGQKIRGAVESMLTTLGAEVLPFADAHLCCGSAGTYSLLQPQLSRELRDRKLAALSAPQPEVILSANIGCLTHLAGGTGLPVQHWIEWLDEQLA